MGEEVNRKGAVLGSLEDTLTGKGAGRVPLPAKGAARVQHLLPPSSWSPERVQGCVCEQEVISCAGLERVGGFVAMEGMPHLPLWDCAAGLQGRKPQVLEQEGLQP